MRAKAYSRDTKAKLDILSGQLQPPARIVARFAELVDPAGAAEMTKLSLEMKRLMGESPEN